MNARTSVRLIVPRNREKEFCPIERKAEYVHIRTTDRSREAIQNIS